MKQFVCFIVVCLSCSIITACGSGSGSGGEGEGGTLSEPLDGYLDLPIEGLPYKTETLSGITTSSGAYRYRDGETVSFYLGKTNFGKTWAAPNIEFSDIVLISTSYNPSKASYLATESPMPSPTYLYKEGEIRETIRAKKPTPQLTLLNELRLLWSLDEDRDPGNGITISELTRLAFDDVSLSFEQTSEQFASDTFSILNELKTPLYTPYTTVAVLYSSIDKVIISGDFNRTRLSVPVYFEEDADGDGVFERRSRYRYDYSGNLIEYSVDYDNNDDYDFVREVKYQYSGQKLAVSLTRNNVPVDSTYYTYDAAGRSTGLDMDRGSNGTIEYSTSIQYDSLNNVVTTEYDTNNDGVAESTAVVQFGESGQIIKETLSSIEGGYQSYEITYSYTDSGSQTKEERDLGSDGIIDSVSIITFDLDGNKTRIELDQNADGKTDTVRSFIYDGNGNLLEENIDKNNDGISDHREVSTYDYAGRKLSFYQYDENGDIELSEKNEYSTVGKLTLHISETYGDDASIVTRKYIYNSYGKLSSLEYRTTKNTSQNYIQYYHYQLDFYVTRIEVDEGIDGTIDSLKEQEYDSEWRLKRLKYDYDNDGVVDYIANMEWQASTQIDARNQIIDAYLSGWGKWSVIEFELVLNYPFF